MPDRGPRESRLLKKYKDVDWTIDANRRALESARFADGAEISAASDERELVKRGGHEDDSSLRERCRDALDEIDGADLDRIAKALGLERK